MATRAKKEAAKRTARLKNEARERAANDRSVAIAESNRRVAELHRLARDEMVKQWGEAKQGMSRGVRTERFVMEIDVGTQTLFIVSAQRPSEIAALPLAEVEEFFHAIERLCTGSLDEWPVGMLSPTVRAGVRGVW